MRGSRWLAMGFLAPLAAAVTGVAMFELIGVHFPIRTFIVVTLIAGLPIALLHLFLVAAPFYSMGVARWPLRWWNAALGGALVGAGPATILFALLAIGGLARGEGLHVLSLGFLILLGGLPGLVGGLVFRAIRGRNPRDAGVSA